MGHEPDLQNTVRGCEDTKLDLGASSVHFQVAHQPRIETLAAAAAAQEPIPAGFALVTQTHTPTRTQGFERICFRGENLICSANPATLSPSESSLCSNI